MMGVGKALMSTGDVIAPYSVNLNPGFISAISQNGSNTSSRVYSTVISGVGPYTYSWEITGDKITINSPDKDSTTFSASGYNDQYEEVAVLKVIDTGNGNAETSREIKVSFEFEDFNNIGA